MQCADYYAGISSGYDRLHSEEQLAKAELIRKHAMPRGLLLDIGAGTGIATRAFQDKAECIALDSCKEMLRHFPGMRVAARAEQLPFKENAFDSIVSVTALHHADLPRVREEIARVAKENASIALSFFKRAANFQDAKRLFSAFKKIDSEKDLLFVLK